MNSIKSQLSKRGFVSLIGLLITLIIIVMLYYLYTNTLTKKGSSEYSKEGSTPNSVLDRAKKAVGDINKRQSDNAGDY